MSNQNYPPNLDSGSDRGGSQPVAMVEEEGVDLRDIATVLWNGKWIIAGITAIVLALALIYAFLATPIYQANALIQIEQSPNQPIGPSADILSMLLPVAAPTQAEIAIMGSRSVLQPTVQKENLNIVVDEGGLDHSGPSGDPKVMVASLTVPPGWMGKPLTLTAKGGKSYVLDSPDGDKVLAGRIGEPASARGGAVKFL